MSVYGISFSVFVLPSGIEFERYSSFILYVLGGVPVMAAGMMRYENEQAVSCTACRLE